MPFWLKTHNMSTDNSSGIGKNRKSTIIQNTFHYWITWMKSMGKKNLIHVAKKCSSGSRKMKYTNTHLYSSHTNKTDTRPVTRLQYPTMAQNRSVWSRYGVSLELVWGRFGSVTKAKVPGTRISLLIHTVRLKRAVCNICMQRRYWYCLQY